MALSGIENIVELVNEAVLISDTKGNILIINTIANSLLRSLKEKINTSSGIEGFAVDENENLLLCLDKVVKTQKNNKSYWQLSAINKHIYLASSQLFIWQNEQFLWITLSKKTESETEPTPKISDSSTSIFLSNIAHEIRTPLNSIIGFSELLLKKKVTEEKHKEFLSIIYSNGNYMMQLVTEMLDLSRLEAGKLQLYKTEFSINRLLYELQLFFVLDMKIKQKAHIQLRLNPGFADGNDLITADEMRIKQVLINLIGNSIKFTQEGEIEVAYKRIENDLIRFCIHDTGLGMTKEAQERIFDRFEQADRTIEKHFGGSGIGLTISKELVEMHGGSIWVESELKKGTSFYFTLPYL